MHLIRMASGLLIIGIASTPILQGADESLTEDRAIELANETLRDHLGDPAVEIDVGVAEATEWSDSGLGCRQEGEIHSKMEVRGFRILLTAGSRDYVVHIGAGRALICWPPEEGSALPLPDNQEHRVLVELAIGDLVDRLEVAREEIDFLGINLVTWPDASLGCPRPGMSYTQATREGYQIQLRSGTRRYAYHSGLGGPPFFCERPSPPIDQEVNPGAQSDRNR